MNLFQRIFSVRSCPLDAASARRSDRRRRGMAAVEFALTAPVMAAILIGALEFGHYFAQLEMVNSAAYDAVRAGAFEPTRVRAIVRAESTFEVLLEDVGFTCSPGCTAEANSLFVDGIEMLELNVVVDYDQLTGIIPGGTRFGFAAPNTLRARAVMPIVGP